jgi:glycosyltransferase involved in cell wall biosynthesis
VEHDEHGLLFPHENDEVLADHIVALLRDPVRAKRLGEAGRRRVRTRFSTGTFAANMNALYAGVLGDAPDAGIPRLESL